MNNRSNSTDSSHITNITVYDFFKHLIKWQKFIIIISLIFFVSGIIISLSLTKIYQATSVIIPPTSQNSLANLSSVKNLPFDISSSMFGLGSGSQDQLGRYIVILQSTKLQMAVIDSFNLASYYGFTKGKKYFIEDVLRTFNKNVTISSNDEITLQVSVLDTSPQHAAAMANFLVLMLDSINKDISRVHSGKKKDFLYSRMMENREKLNQAEDSLVAFQKTKGLIEIKKQAEESINAIGEAETKLMLAELNLSIDKSKFVNNNQLIKEKTIELDAMRKYISDISTKNGYSVLLPVSKIPMDALSYERMLRKIAIMDVLDKYLSKEYETTAIEEKSTIPTIAVLDSARVPQKRIKPKRTFFVFIATGIGLTCGVLLSIFLQAIYSARTILPPIKGLNYLIKFISRFEKNQ